MGGATVWDRWPPPPPPERGSFNLQRESMGLSTGRMRFACTKNRLVFTTEGEIPEPGFARSETLDWCADSGFHGRAGNREEQLADRMGALAECILHKSVNPAQNPTVFHKASELYPGGGPGGWCD